MIMMIIRVLQIIIMQMITADALAPDRLGRGATGPPVALRCTVLYYTIHYALYTIL